MRMGLKLVKEKQLILLRNLFMKPCGDEMKLGIYINKQKQGRISFSLAQLGDGLVRTLSLGFLRTEWPLLESKERARRSLLKRGIRRLPPINFTEEEKRIEYGP